MRLSTMSDSSTLHTCNVVFCCRACEIEQVLSSNCDKPKKKRIWTLIGIYTMQVNIISVSGGTSTLYIFCYFASTYKPSHIVPLSAGIWWQYQQRQWTCSPFFFFSFYVIYAFHLPPRPSPTHTRTLLSDFLFKNCVLFSFCLQFGLIAAQCIDLSHFLHFIKKV